MTPSMLPTNLFAAFSRIKKERILVIGDLSLDTYTIGKAKRISPEAPVPILLVDHEEHRPGMSGNVALNLISMGGEVSIVSRVGNDFGGQRLISDLEKEGIKTAGILTQDDFTTPVKNRVIANNQQMVRVDYERVIPLKKLLEQELIERFPDLLAEVKVVAVSDYGKGFITPNLLKALIQCARRLGVYVIADPKGADFSRYRKAHVVKPNLSEVYAAANLAPEAPLDWAAERVLKSTEADTLIVTRSEEGISLFYRDGRREDFPVSIREVKDVTGAGDTVLAMLAIASASGLSLAEGVRLSNIAAGIAIERFGCARITLSDLARRLLEDSTENKVFDEEHLFALQEALKGREFSLLFLSSKEGVGSSLFEAIHQLAKRKHRDLLVCVEDDDPPRSFIDVLASLHCIDYILVKHKGRESICQFLSPKEVHWIDQGSLVASLL